MFLVGLVLVRGDSPRFLHKLSWLNLQIREEIFFFFFKKEIKRESGFGENFLSTLFTAKVGTFCHCIGGGGIRKGHFEVHISYNTLI